MRGHRLTDIHGPEATRQHGETFNGQAHFAGTGPKGMLCHQCLFWNSAYDTGDAGKFTRHYGFLDRQCCEKYEQLMGEPGPAVPAAAQACRHFDFNIDFPALIEGKTTT